MDDVARGGPAVDAESSVPRLDDADGPDLGDQDGRAVAVGGGLVRAARVPVDGGGVVDLAGVDVGLGQGVAGGAGGGLTRVERGRRGRAAHGHRRIGDDDPVRVTLPVLVRSKV